MQAGPVMDLGYIDVNTLMGPAHGLAGGATPVELARERRNHGIHLALVRHRTALRGHAPRGNREVLEACAGDSGLLPIVVLRPDRTESLDDASALGPRVAGFWLAGNARPGNGSRATEAVLRSAGRTGKPLLVEIGGYGEASAIAAATADLGVPVVLVGTNYENAVDVLAAARNYDHLYLETSRMAYLGALDIAASQIGAERILLGTGAPLRAVQPSLNAIALAHLPDDAKRAILGGNAARLFGLPAFSIELPELCRPERTIDVHAHSGWTPQDVSELSDADLMVELARQNNTRYAIASNILAIDADSEAGNRELVEGCARLPNRLGYLYVDPDDLPATRDQIRRWGDAPGIVGAKVSCETSARHTGSPQIWDLFKVLADFGKPVKIHNDGADWDVHLGRIAREHPRLPIIVAHGGLGCPDLAAARLASELDNVYVELCSSFAQIPSVRAVVQGIPRHKLMFGTDAPLLSPGFVLGMYQDAEIPSAHRDDVYYANAARLFGLE